MKSRGIVPRCLYSTTRAPKTCCTMSGDCPGDCHLDNTSPEDMLYEAGTAPVIVIDSSAILAILNDEPERRIFNQAIEQTDTCLISTAIFVEASIVIQN